MKTVEYRFSFEVKKVLTKEWQTAFQISEQITIPPERIGRNMARVKRTPRGAKSDLVAKVCINLCTAGFAEKRRIEKTIKNQYRLAQN